eukprot:1160465-Pelagomonas_calceolata.AAC.5
MLLRILIAAYLTSALFLAGIPVLGASENAHYGTPHNAAAPGRVPGGSSSGSAVGAPADV